ncbi:hypothetical protein CONPUDRAFT_68079 [Coniophora puteana RWD-64-598 SS2]|uniref:BTB domain-containing protein n=1 Tax=Coniophora puteana (strain RWD-64-598) TaxID=741705 RepID=R7SFX4_CONPW|nr:uncharacterized protein CONPUDRAFT_68079 [Coniophora puteana RWD-64-598 SS2]EIW73989.1 hypothetical protein CONPUDRAFT_68079 [Coniophora puteana RWD-64-598 SS2]
MATQIDATASAAAERHPRFWFDDGSLVLRARGQPDVLFKVHRSLLERQRQQETAVRLGEVYDAPDGVSEGDLTALFEHLYHDIPLSRQAPPSHIIAVLRASSPGQLDLPQVHALARGYFEEVFGGGPAPFEHPAHLEEALGAANRYGIHAVKKPLFYSLLTTSEFEPEIDTPGDVGGPTVLGAGEQQAEPELVPSIVKRHVLSPADVDRCRSLMTGVVDHFTPILFTPPTSHMDCTDILADKWLPLVIQPAIEDDGVYKPLETLERIKRVDWVSEGICAACAREKREEWTRDQENVWEKMDGWLKL